MKWWSLLSGYIAKSYIAVVGLSSPFFPSLLQVETTAEKAINLRNSSCRLNLVHGFPLGPLGTVQCVEKNFYLTRLFFFSPSWCLVKSGLTGDGRSDRAMVFLCEFPWERFKSKSRLFYYVYWLEKSCSKWSRPPVFLFPLFTNQQYFFYFILFAFWDDYSYLQKVERTFSKNSSLFSEKVLYHE